MLVDQVKSFAFGCLELCSVAAFIGALALWADVLAAV
jgi:hypothetical protein